MSSEAKMSMQTIEELQENFSTFTEHATALVSLLELYKKKEGKKEYTNVTETRKLANDLWIKIKEQAELILIVNPYPDKVNGEGLIPSEAICHPLTKETKPNPSIDTETIDDSLAPKEILEATSEAIYEPTPTEKEFVESYNKILKDDKSQTQVDEEITKLNFGNGQKPKRMGMSNIGDVLNFKSKLPKFSEDSGGNFYSLREDDYYFVVPISGIDVTENDAIKQVFEIQGNGKYIKEVIKPARFQIQVKQDNIQVQAEQDNIQVQAEQDNIITFCSRGQVKISP